MTDNPVSAELVLFDVPFGPTYEEADKRMMLPLTDAPVKGVHHVVCWSDIVTSTAKLGNSSAQDKDREALAAVAAAGVGIGAAGTAAEAHRRLAG